MVRGWVQGAKRDELPDADRVQVVRGLVDSIVENYGQRTEPEVWAEVQVFVLLQQRVAALQNHARARRRDEALNVLRSLQTVFARGT